MVLFALPNAYGKGFYPIGTEILLHRASVDVRWAGLIRLFETNGYFSELYCIAAKILNNVPYGKIYESLGKSNHFGKGKLGYISYGKTFSLCENPESLVL